MHLVNLVRYAACAMPALFDNLLDRETGQPTTHRRVPRGGSLFEARKTYTTLFTVMDTVCILKVKHGPVFKV